MAVLHDTRPSAPRWVSAKRSTGKIDPIVTAFLKDTLTDYDPAQVSLYNGNPVYAAPALALDKGVLMGGGKEVPLCEVEVELKEGSDAAALAFAKVLAEEFGLTPEPLSKIARAQELAANT